MNNVPAFIGVYVTVSFNEPMAFYMHMHARTHTRTHTHTHLSEWALSIISQPT